MKIADFEIGQIYQKENGSLIYKCVEQTRDWVLVIAYSDKHNIAYCVFWNQEMLDEEFNQSLHEVNSEDESWYNRIFTEHLEVYRKTREKDTTL